jgi:hypothetical protein
MEEIARPDKTKPDLQKLQNSPRPTGRDGEQEAKKNGSKDGSGSSDRDKR